ncbi:hypothetical protein, partial [Alistipes communis]|uniref:hypothetical protein n=1 Tax=Alistipes communis TaxID=2585118 RepID=UPI00266FDD72
SPSFEKGGAFSVSDSFVFVGSFPRFGACHRRPPRDPFFRRRDSLPFGLPFSGFVGNGRGGVLYLRSERLFGRFCFVQK